ncbi:hypothetical protein TWF694_001566 [Orbilia ellipsospora]|uniref:Cytochrome P450 n=1 Tax=Orbilia ellipsospora TaxID=2528407 RepID=A0AAV9XTJ7_9PEZI
MDSETTHLWTLLTLGPGLAAAVLISLNGISLILNIYKARKIGLPYLIGPVSSTNPFWHATHTKFNWIIQKYGWDGLKLSCLSWPLEHRHRMAEKYGLTEGPDWVRSRKISSAPLNERNNAVVWEKSIGSIEELLEKDNKDGLPTKIDFLDHSMSILMAAGLGTHYSGVLSEGRTYSSRQSLEIVIRGLLPLYLFPRFLVPKRILSAYHDFGEYMRSLVEIEKAEVASHENGIHQTKRSSLISALVSEYLKSHSLDETSEKTKVLAKPYTNTDVVGNLFLLLAAGHDTTGNTLKYTFSALAVYPEIQDWLYEEISAVVNEFGWDYKAFPELVRCLAMLYETLRLYPIIPHLFRHTIAATNLDLNDAHELDSRVPSSVDLPLGVYTLVTLGSIHTHPLFWGDDGLDFNPKRWIKHTEGQVPREFLQSPAPKNTFFAWAGGFHTCIGKKYSEVESLATIARILYSYKVEAVPLDGESVKETKLRALSVMEDAVISPTRKIARPDDFSYRFIQRDPQG